MAREEEGSGVGARLAGERGEGEGGGERGRRERERAGRWRERKTKDMAGIWGGKVQERPRRVGSSSVESFRARTSITASEGSIYPF